MKQFQKRLHVRTKPKSFEEITDAVRAVVDESGIASGLCVVFIRHTSASLVIQENADPAVLRDLERWMSKVAPEGARYEHDAEGPDDMPSHIRAALTKSSESIPVSGGRLALGTWQALYVWEHRAHAHDRELVVQVMGV